MFRAVQTVNQIIQHAVPRRSSLARPCDTGIPKVMGLVDYDDVCHLSNPLETLGETSTAAEVGMVENHKVAKITLDIIQVLLQRHLPYGIASGFGDKQGDTFALVHNKPLDEHQSDESFPKTYTVT